MKDLTTETQNILTKARESANKRKHDYVSSEHILEAFLEDNTILPSDLVEKIKIRLNETVKDGSSPILVNPPLTPRTKKILVLASKEAESGRIDFVTPWFLFIGLVKEANGVAGQILKEFDITYSNIYTKSFLKDETIKNVSYPKITVEQVAATLQNSPTTFAYVLSEGDRNTSCYFSNRLAELFPRHDWKNVNQLTFVSFKAYNQIRGMKKDIVIIESDPSQEQKAILETITSRSQGEVIAPRGIYMAYIPEKPKTVEERLAALEELVAEGQKLGFYRSCKTPISY